MTIQAAMFFASLGFTEEEISYDYNEMIFEYRDMHFRVSKIAATDWDKAREVRTFMIGAIRGSKTVSCCLMWATKEDFMDTLYEKICHLTKSDSSEGADKYVISEPSN